MSLIGKIKKGVRFLKRKEQVPIMKVATSEDLLENHVALITGGNSGIGFSIAKKFVESGCAVIIAGRSESKLQSCVKILGEKAKYITLDVSDVNDIREKIPVARKLFSGKIDILVNCAGVGVKHSFWDIDEKEYDNIMNTNTRGMFFASQIVSEYT